MRSRTAFAFLLLFWFTGCPSIVWNDRPADTAHTPGAQPSPQSSPDPELRRQLEEIAKDAKGKVGVYAVVIETGESVGLNENDRFAMQSIVKLPVSMAVMKMVDEGKLRLDQLVNVQENDMTITNQRSPIRDRSPKGTQISVEELIEEAVVESDGTASDVLQRLAGGAAGVQAYVDSLGIREMMIVWSHKEFGSEWTRQYDNWSTPAGSVELMRKLWEASVRNESVNERGTLEPTATLPDGRVSARSADVLLKFMTESNNPEDRILGMLPEGTVVAHKTGTGGTRDGVTSATNDVGIITLPNGKHIAIAVYIGDSSGSSKERADTIAKIAKIIFDQWSGARNAPPVNQIGFNDRHTLN